jgi:cell division protein FtsL
MVGVRRNREGIRIANKRVKRPIFHFTRKRVFFVLFVLFLFMGSGMVYVWTNFKSTQIGYDLSELEKEEMRLREINNKLKVELALLKSPQKLEAIATQKLGLIRPEPERIIVLK